jgi:hypothetical protein
MSQVKRFLLHMQQITFYDLDVTPSHPKFSYFHSVKISGAATTPRITGINNGQRTKELIEYGGYDRMSFISAGMELFNDECSYPKSCLLYSFTS